MDFQVGSLSIYSIFQALPCFHPILFTCGTSCLYAEQIALKILQFQVLFNVLFLLRKPSWVCSLHDRLIIRRKGVEARNSNFIWKVRYPRRWWNHGLGHPLTGLWMTVCFIDRESEEVRLLSKKAINLAKHLLAWLALGEGVYWVLFCSHSQVSRVRMSPCKLDKGTLA